MKLKRHLLRYTRKGVDFELKELERKARGPKGTLKCRERGLEYPREIENSDYRKWKQRTNQEHNPTKALRKCRVEAGKRMGGKKRFG